MSSPRREGPFAHPIVAAVHQRVEHLQAVVAHADGVHVGKRHAQLAAHRAMILADHVQFAAHILRRLNDARQNEAGDEIFEFGVEHGSGRWPVVGDQTMIIVELLGRRQCRTTFYGAGLRLKYQ